MFQTPDVFSMASAMVSNAAASMSAIAQNVANADTPGYRAKSTADFASAYQDASNHLVLTASRPGHLSGSAVGFDTSLGERQGGHMSPNGNNVSLEDEMMAAAIVRKDHDTALAIYKKSLDILRASLGRR